MDILESVEVRWFLPNDEPPHFRESVEVRWFLPNDERVISAVHAWFKAVPAERERRDDYLNTGRDDLGFKARDIEKQPAKLETKYLIGSLNAVQFAPGV